MQITMKAFHFSFSPRTLILTTVLCVAYFFTSAALAEAASVMLSVNGGSSATVNQGSSVTLSWEAVGISGCSINNGIGSVAASGSRSVTPPNSGATYTITCSSLSDSATISIKPYVDIYSTPGVATPATAGAPVAVKINWNATNATQCTKLTARGVVSNVTRTLFSNVRPAVGSFNDSISEETVYTATCSNPQTGLSRTGTHTTGYGAPGLPAITSFTVNVDSPADWEAEWAGVLMRLKFASTNATKCPRYARNASGAMYTLPGWTAATTSNAAGNIQAGFYAVISTTTTLTLVCGRTTDNKWTQQSITVAVNPPPVSAVAEPVTAELIAPANVSVPLASNLPARVSVQTQSGSANRCSFFAYNAVTNATTSVSGWTDRLTDWYRMNGTFDVLLNQSTRLRYECYRTTDGGIARDDATINVAVTGTEAPALVLGATPTGYDNNAPTIRLNWDSSNVNGCSNANVKQNGSIIDNWYSSGAIPLSGVKTVSVYGPTTYELTCTNSVTSQIATATVSVQLVDGDVVVDASVDVDVNGGGGGGSSLTEEEVAAYRSSVSITADPRIIRQQDRAVVTWTAHSDLLDGCSLYEGNAPVGLVVAETVDSIARGTFESRPLRVERVFTIDCDIPDEPQSASFSASVRVLPRVTES